MVALYMLQNFKAILSRHMEVENQQIGSGVFKGCNCLVAIADNVQPVRESCPL